MTIETISEEINEAMLPTAKEAAQMVSRLAALKAASFITTDGDVLTATDFKRESEYLTAMLKNYIEVHGPIYVEGVGEQQLQPRSGPYTWDVKALAEHDPATFKRLLDHGALTINTPVADALEKAGQVSMFRQYGVKGAAMPALIIKKG
jgi:hypothetical protein